MIKEYTYKGGLIVSENDVTLKTGIPYLVVAIEFVGNININSLLSSNFIVKKGYKKILIANINYNSELSSYKEEIKLFEYYGKAQIIDCSIITTSLREVKIPVDRSVLQLWTTMARIPKDNYDITQDEGFRYEDMTVNWEDLDFDGDNSRMNQLYNYREYDYETKKYTTTRQIRKRKYGR